MAAVKQPKRREHKVNKRDKIRKIVLFHFVIIFSLNRSEESSSKLDIHVPHYVSQIHMIYGDAEKDGLLSKCLKFDIRSSFSTFRIITESQIKVLHVWYKPPIAARVKCTKILFYLNGRLSNVLNPGPQSNLYYDTLDGVGLGANVALEEPDFAEDGFSFEKSEDDHGSCDIFNIEKCKFCAWTGSWFGKDNHYMEGTASSPPSRVKSKLKGHYC